MKLGPGRLLWALGLLPVLVIGCGPSGTGMDEPTSPASPPATFAPTLPTASPSLAATAGGLDPTEAWVAALATLDVQLTSEPCSADKVLAYSNAVLPLSDEHMADAAVARQLDGIDDPALVDEMYDRAISRRDRLDSLVPPNCASTAHLKFTSAFRLLIDVWDHIGEREFGLAQRKLESSFVELANGAELLAALQSRLSSHP